MDPILYDWLNLLLRWIHVIAAISWIGHAIFFNWLDRNLSPKEGSPKGLGDIWMIHGGGFYHTEKNRDHSDQWAQISPGVFPNPVARKLLPGKPRLLRLITVLKWKNPGVYSNRPSDYTLPLIVLEIYSCPGIGHWSL